MNQYFHRLFHSIPVLWVLLAIVAIEVLSFTGHTFAIVNDLTFWGIVAATCAVGMYRLHWAVFALIIELIMSSKGYLFAVPIGGFELSVRLGMFLALFAAYAIWVIRERQIAFFQWPLWKWYSAIVAVLLYGAVSGYVNGNGLATIFFDANGYLFFGLALPFTQAIRNREALDQLLAIVWTATAALFAKTLAILFLFAHNDFFQWETLTAIYRWVRDTGVGEITQFPSGFSRVFFQSHIYLLISLFAILPWALLSDTSKKNRQMLYIWAVVVASITGVLVSYSRSFWVAVGATLVVAAVGLLATRLMSLRQFGRGIIGLVISTVLSFGLILLVVNFPLPGHQGIDSGDLLTERTTDQGDEAAVSSRKQLLKPLTAAALDHPVFGSGLGATVTYISSDPRVRENNPSGEYTTFAFEWGYLDLWVKFGALGTLILGAAIIAIINRLWSTLRVAELPRRLELIGALASLTALLATHFFTPYINHPLGIGWLIIVSLIAVLPQRVKTD